MVTNTSAAFNLIKAFYQKYGQFPQEWGSGDYQVASFAFVKEKDGIVTKKVGLIFPNPTDFFTALREFYELDNVQTAAEKRKAELQALIASRMPPSPRPEAPKPPSTSPFKYRK